MTATVKVILDGASGNAPLVEVTGSDADVYGVLNNDDFLGLLAKAGQRNEQFQGEQALVTELGATPVVEEGGGTVAPPWQGESNKGEDLWDQAAKARQAQEEQPKSDPAAELRDLISSATSVDEIRDIWAQHSDAIKANGLVDHWQVTGKALKAAVV